MFCEGGVLGRFMEFRGKRLLQKVAGLRPAALLKERLWHRCFPAGFVKFLGAPFCIEHLWWLLLSLTIITLFVCHHLCASFSLKISDLRQIILFFTIYLSSLNKVYTEIQSRTTLLLKCKHYCMLSKHYQSKYFFSLGERLLEK